MYSVVLQKIVQEKLDAFIHSILERNLRFFEDTGIDNVEFIEDNYLRNSEMLRKNILKEIGDKASSEIIGTMEYNRKKCFVIQVASFRMFIYYFEDIQEKVRYIQNIEFYRK